MTDRTQPGVRLDSHTWERFREFVKQQNGGIRGNLRREVEAALRNHMDAARGPNELERIENDVATIKAMLAEGEADGGVSTPSPTPSEAEDTRTPETRKPKANQPRAKKIDYLVSKVYGFSSGLDESGGEISPKDIRNIIQREYGFQNQTEDKYLELIRERIDAEPHPMHGQTLVWGDRIEKERERAKEELSDS